jgi:hypothetical protein
MLYYRIHTHTHTHKHTHTHTHTHATPHTTLRLLTMLLPPTKYIESLLFFY